MKLVPIKITLQRGDTRKGEPQIKHPKGHDAQYIDSFGMGMKYNEFRTEALTAVSQEYANEYIATSSGKVVQITEAEAEQWFIDNQNESDIKVNDRVKIEALALKKQAGIDLSPEEVKAFDPDDPTPGIVRNNRKGFKNKLPK